MKKQPGCRERASGHELCFASIYASLCRNEVNWLGFRIIASGKTNKHLAKYTDLLIKILPFR